MPEDWAMSETVRGLGPASGVKRKMVIKMWVWVGVPRLLIRSNAHMGIGAKGPGILLFNGGLLGVPETIHTNPSPSVAYTVCWG